MVAKWSGKEIVQRVLGHSDIYSIQGYAELDDLQVREIPAGANQCCASTLVLLGSRGGGFASRILDG